MVVARRASGIKIPSGAWLGYLSMVAAGLLVVIQ